MATCTFRSPVAARLQAFWEMRRCPRTQRESELKILTYLDRFLMGELKPGRPITAAIADRWFKSMEHLNTGTRINRMSLLRQFCSYLSNFDPRTCVIHQSFLPRRNRPAPHIYSPQEVMLDSGCRPKIGPKGSLRPALITTLIGLLYSTGLRIGEALKLTLADVDIQSELLTIRETKFKKSRYVPLSPSTAHHLADFCISVRKQGSLLLPLHLCLSVPPGRAYGPGRICEIFLEILRDVGLRGPKGERGPRIHDFRHTFAVNRLPQWYRQGGNINAKLPLLATYLGHSSLAGTEIYLHATAELLKDEQTVPESLRHSVPEAE